MKALRISPSLVPFSALLLLALAPAAYAVTAPAVSLADNLGNTIIVDGTGAITYGGACTPTTCTTVIIYVTSGETFWAGTIGSFSLQAVVGTTKPFAGPNPSQDLSLQNVTSSTGGTLTVQWTDINFNYSDITNATILAGGIFTGTGTATFKAYFDNTNAPFGTGVPVGMLGPFSGSAFNGTLTGPGPTAAPFSMTEAANITLGPGAVFGVDFQFIPLPAPLQVVCASSTGQVGVPYKSALMAAGGIVPYTYSIVSGNLPSGLTLDASTGTISGTPTQAGTFSFTAQVTDSSESSANTATSNCTIVITSPPPISLACPMSTGQVGMPYSSALTASGGVPPYTYSIQSGMLPNGLSLNPSTGAITGTPTQAGPFSFVGQVTDSTNSAAGTTTSNCGITIAPLPTASCVSITAVEGVAITPVTMTATGGTGSGYTFSATGLPSGLTMSTGGTISGTPTVSGTFPYTVTIKDSGGNTGTINCSVTVAPPVTASCVSITAIQGVAITPVTMTATGGTGSGYTFSATGLPSGLTMSTGGTISGIPTVSGTFPYTVIVMDSAGDTGTINCSVTVAQPVSASCVSITAVQGVAITPVTMTATGGTGSGYTFSATGLPTGLTMSTGGTISGTPTVSGTFPYTVTIKDSAGDTGTINCSVTVAPPMVPSISVTKAANPSATTPVSAVTYTYTVTNTGGTNLTNVTVTDDNGTPGYTGDDFVVGTVSSLAPGASQQFTVSLIPALNECVTVNGVAGTPAGILVTQVLPTGDVKVTFRQSTTLVDNTYGSNASAGWGSMGHKFSDLTGSDEAEFQIYDGQGNEVLDFDFDYISSSSAYPSGYGTLGATGGDGQMNLGSSSWILGVLAPATLSNGTVVRSTTTLTTDLDQSAAFYGYTTNSPSTSDPNYTNWDVADGYTIYISKSAFGSNGFGYALVPHLHNSPSEVSGVIKFFPAACSSYAVTNTATTTAQSGSTNLRGTATASVTETCSQSIPACVPSSSSSGGPPPPPPSGLTVQFPGGPAANGAVGTPYSVTVGVMGGKAPYTFAVTSGTLPAGLSLNPSTGVISGTPTTATSGPAAQITITVTDSSSPKLTGTANGTINIAAPPPLQVQVPSGPSANGTVGTPYSASVTAAGGIGPYTFAITAGTLPAGLTLNGSTGAITGTPTTATSGPAAQITVTVKDSESPQKSVSQNGTINIAPPPPLQVQFPSGPSANGTVGTPYSASVTAAGGIGPYTFAITAGTLPAGLTLNGSTGAITGTPTTATSGPAAQITLTVTDSESPQKSVSQNGTINIAPPPPLQMQFPSGPSANGTVGTSYSASVRATGGIAPYTFAITAGTLPAGLTLNSSTGAITGTPTTATGGPAAQITITVTDSGSPQKSVSQNGTINIAP